MAKSDKKAESSLSKASLQKAIPHATFWSSFVYINIASKRDGTVWTLELGGLRDWHRTISLNRGGDRLPLGPLGRVFSIRELREWNRRLGGKEF